jgi:hypothetical protein
MEPQYFSENRYTYLVGSWRRSINSDYVTESPEGAFEQHLQELFMTGQTHLQHEEFTLALNVFQDAMALILKTVHPTLPLDFGAFNPRFPMDVTLVDVLTAKTADILLKTSPVQYALPASLVGPQSMVSAQVLTALQPLVESGLRVTSFHKDVETSVGAGLEAAARNDWGSAISLYEAALAETPATELAIRGGLQHDLAVLNEQAANRPKAQELAQASVASFTEAKITDAQVQALATTSGIFARSGNTQKATELNTRLTEIANTNILQSIVSSETVVSTGTQVTGTRLGTGTISTSRLSPLAGAVSPLAGSRLGTLTRDVRARAASPALALDPAAPQLMGLRFVKEATSVKALTIKGIDTQATIELTQAGAAASTTRFLQTIAETKDIGLLTGWFTPIHFVAYVPHMYFYVLPMSIGDCYAGMGNLDDARQSYASVLVYPFINRNYEIIKVWTRLAQSLLDLGDQAYRRAKDDLTASAAATAFYEQIVLGNKTLNNDSQLYAAAQFAGIKTRVTAFLAAPNPTQVADNPAILTIVLDAHGKLQQIAAGLNFFGFAPNYTPPFSFEYLQNTARYFAQHASQTEQRYIQYKSQAENEEFRREQLDQQAEVARQTVILEQRGRTEAQRGVEVALASQAYAQVQTENAVAARDDFDNARWELLELSTIEAWANASSVDRDDQVKLSISGYDYYGADHKRRNVVLKELAYQRTLLSQDLEAARLDRAVTSAQAYEAVTQAQIGQAQARVAVAEQRVAIAQLQQRQAEENRDFLDMREFGARLWYELAQQAKRLTRRYLDMATEVAFLMERAYNAETERGLSVIRYDYQSTASGNLMGADQLAADIDSFTVDYVTTTKAKKNPVKKIISLADAYPTQFHRLKASGLCTFETRLADFDREHPGLYLAKLRNVEVMFVGLGGVRSVAGTLRNIGVSRFRTAAGAIVDRLYPADVMVLSQYEIRADALAFRVNPNDLQLFENNGIETFWRLDLPPDANDFDYSDLLDVHLVLYYDGFYDRNLEQQVRATLPAAGSASRVVSMKFVAPDELFYMKNQGEAELVFDATMFPRTQKDLVRTTNVVKLTGRPDVVRQLTLRLVSDALGGELVLTTDANGEVLGAAAGSPLASLQGRPVLDRWRLAIRAADNPQLATGGALDLGGLDDVSVFFEYTFNYR